MTAKPQPVRRSVYADKLRDYADVARGDDDVYRHRGRWTDLFRSRIGDAYDGRLTFEIGCADAALITRIAAKHPHTAFVGLDWKCKAIHDGARTATTLGLKNLILLRARAQEVTRLFAPGEVDDCWIFHPEPCDTEVDLPNRLITERFLIDLHDVLRDEQSRVAIKTDHPGYYQWVLSLLGQPHPTWFTADPPDGAAFPRFDPGQLTPPHLLPSPSHAVRERFMVTVTSADFWNDPAVLRHTSSHLFANERTLYEDRYVRRRWPIYYTEMRKMR